MAAMSESAPASARQPMSSVAAWPSRKCVPSTITSVETAAAPPATTTAQSSPIQRTTREPGRSASTSRIAAKRVSSPMAVDDPRAVEVVRRDLDPDAVAGEDADAEAPHLAGAVAEHLVAVVELHPEHRVRERLDDLAFELDFLFLRQELYDPDVRRLGALGALAELVFDLGSFGEGAEPVAGDRGEVDERVLASVIGRDEAEALLVAEPLHDTGSHLQALLAYPIAATRRP